MIVLLVKAYCFYVVIEGVKASRFIKEMLRRKDIATGKAELYGINNSLTDNA